MKTISMQINKLYTGKDNLGQQILGILVEENTLEDYKGEIHVVSDLVSSKDYLIFARKKYSRQSLFLSATGKIKSPITVINVQEALNEDRVNEVKETQKNILSIWNTLYPKRPKDCFRKLDFKDHVFENIVKEPLLKLELLKSSEKDIINLEGGVIFCGETLTWAKKV